MRLKYKLLAGFFLINAMLIVAGVMSIIELTKMRTEAISIIDGNYKTLHGLNLMFMSVEEEDKAVLMLMLGQWETGRSILKKADSAFSANYKVSIQSTSENTALKQVQQQYLTMKHLWELPIVDTKKQGNINWYYNAFMPAYEKTIQQIEKAMEYSQKQLHAESKQLLENSHRALMPGIVAIISAILMSMLMYFFISRFFAKPIEKILEGVKKYNDTGKSFSVAVNTNDELNELAKEIKKTTEDR